MAKARLFKEQGILPVRGKISSFNSCAGRTLSALVISCACVVYCVYGVVLHPPYGESLSNSCVWRDITSSVHSLWRVSHLQSSATSTPPLSKVIPILPSSCAYTVYISSCPHSTSNIYSGISACGVPSYGKLVQHGCHSARSGDRAV